MFSNKMFLVFCYIRLLKEFSLITIIIFLISITLLIPNDFNVPTRKVSRHIELSNVSTHFDFRHDQRRYPVSENISKGFLYFFRQKLTFTIDFLQKSLIFFSNVPTRNLSRHIGPSNVSTHFDFRHDSDQKTKGKSESLKLRLAILS